MIRRSLLYFFSFGVVCHAGVFPPADDVFQPLKADPRELQYAIRLVVPVAGHRLGEAAMGDYFGVYRWDLTPDVPLQFNVGGGIFGRFDLTERTNDLQVVDFLANLPLDIRKGPWSGRFMLYHESSHAGDDYVARTGQTVVKHSWDVARLLGSYEANPHVRLYGGASYSFRSLPADDRQAVQGGLELQSPWVSNHWQFFWANDLQSWARVDWNPQYNSQVGVTYKTGNDLNPRTVTFFTEYGTGHMPQGQFYEQTESRWTLGVRLNLS